MKQQTPRTLIIDDEHDTQQMLARVLSDCGSCATCASGGEALQRLEREAFDVVVSDIAMPGLDGFELLERINRRPVAPPVILISGRPQPGGVRRALRGGAFDLLQKPLDIRELRQAVTDAARAGRPSHKRCPGGPTACGGATQGRDGLTGLLNHRSFLEAVGQARGQCRRRNDSLSLLLVDLDRFRRINQDHSHAIGDQVLAWVGGLLERLCRDGDIVSRYSWDRFAAALPGCTEAQAGEIAERCKNRLAAEPMRAGGLTISVAASIGVAELGPGFSEGPGDLIDRAEQALAAAKQDGGRRVVAFSGIAHQTPSRRRLDRASVETVSGWIAAMRRQLRQAYVESTRALVGAVEAKDPHTRRHSLRVADYAEELARRLGLSASRIESLRTAAALHDVGKIGVPDAILQKPGPLDCGEFALIQQHPETALQILGHASFLSGELPIILHHHERYDGRGYPAGLAGEQIPFAARILAVADSLDAMSSHRSYKDSYSVDRVRNELGTCAGTQWDPTVAQAAVDWLDEQPEALHGANSQPATSEPQLVAATDPARRDGHLQTDGRGPLGYSVRRV